MDKNTKKTLLIAITTALVGSIFMSVLSGAFTYFYVFPKILNNKDLFLNNGTGRESAKSQEQIITDIVAKASSAVVSVIVTKDVPVMQERQKNSQDFLKSPFDFFFGPQYEQKGTEKKQIGGGTGFFISADGLIVTNKHVVEDEAAEYTVLINENEKISAKVLARDPVQDLAILKIDKIGTPYLALGDSNEVKIGQTVIAIGNALGEFRNTVSVGVISGLKRSITAGDGSSSEVLDGVIQTDAAINPGNSGGPLLSLKGEVIGINAAVAQGAQNIAFALPINIAKKDVEMARNQGKIAYPYLGIRYIMINEAIKEKNNLSVDYGALVVRGAQADELAIIPGGPADKAGIQENDIILEVDGTKVDENNSLAKLIQTKNIGDTITMKILRKGEEKTIKVKLEEKK